MQLILIHHCPLWVIFDRVIELGLRVYVRFDPESDQERAATQYVAMGPGCSLIPGLRSIRIKRQNVSSLLLRLGRHYPGKKTWGRAHINWLTSLKLEHREQRIAFEEMLLAVRQVRERIERLEQAMREAVADWTLAPVIEAVQAMRGIDMVGAVAFLAELGDLSRFENPRQLMAYLGVTPSERSTGESVKRGGITKAGNTRARRLLIEAAWSYRFPPRVSKDMQARIGAAPRAAREIAWKAQMRLCGRFRTLTRKGKRPTIVVTAIARELSAFIWAINREVAGSHETANQRPGSWTDRAMKGSTGPQPLRPHT